VRLDAAAMQLGEAAHECQPDAQPALRTIEGRRDLREHLEDIGQVLGFDADAGVANGDHRLVAFTLHAEPDVPAARRVLGGIVEQVEDDLCKARGIRTHAQHLVGQGDGDLVGARFDGGARAFDRFVHRVGRLDLLRNAVSARSRSSPTRRCARFTDMPNAMMRPLDARWNASTSACPGVARYSPRGSMKKYSIAR
jgi:hypothetical protein